MSTTSTSTKTWTWAPEVLEFAREKGIQEFLEPLLEATQQLFPDTSSLRLFIEQDPELADDWHLVWELHIDYTGVTDYLEAEKRWITELCRVCPAPLTCVFCLILVPVRNGSS